MPCKNMETIHRNEQCEWTRLLTNQQTNKKLFRFMFLPLSSTGDGMDLARIFFYFHSILFFVFFYFNCVPSMLMQIQANARLLFIEIIYWKNATKPQRNEKAFECKIKIIFVHLQQLKATPNSQRHIQNATY